MTIYKHDLASNEKPGQSGTSTCDRRPKHSAMLSRTMVRHSEQAKLRKDELELASIRNALHVYSLKLCIETIDTID